MKNHNKAGNESAETRGSNLENVYSSILGAKINGGFNDGGADIIFGDDSPIKVVQIKSSVEIAEKFLAESLKRQEFIHLIVGDPGQHTKEEIIESLIENGGWVGIDQPNRKKYIEKIKMVKDYILSNGGSIKE